MREIATKKKNTQLRQEEERAPDDISQPRTRQVTYMWKKIEVQEDPEASFQGPEAGTFLGNTTNNKKVIH